MRTRTLCGWLAAAAMVVGTVVPARGLESAFTYQGRIEKSGAPVTDTCDLRFSAWTAVSGGSQVGSIFVADGRFISDGLVSERIGFGSDVFTGQPRFLQIALRCPAGSGAFATLPRQELTATPYALHADKAAMASELSCDGCVDSVDLGSGAVGAQQILPGSIELSHLGFTPGTVTSITAGAGLSGGTITGSGAISVAFGSAAGSVAPGDHLHDGRYWKLDGNAGVGQGTHFLGTTDLAPLDLRVNGSRALRLLADSTAPILIGGWQANSASASGGVVAGGGKADDGEGTGANRVPQPFGAVGGGAGNEAGEYAAVGGGRGNAASGIRASIGGGSRNQASGLLATIAGGEDNRATAIEASVGGGGENTAGARSVVAGGRENLASASNASIGGGIGNRATGDYAVVGGGWSNKAEAAFATIGGGGRTDAADAATANWVTDDYGTVGGGGGNLAGNHTITTDAVGATVGGGGFNNAGGAHATVGGGILNFATGTQATVGGGITNLASGGAATVPGGFLNSAEQTGSFAAGVNAHATHENAFVWSDGSRALASTAARQFSALATGGFRLYFDAAGNYCEVTSTSGWNCAHTLSDREAKSAIEPTDGARLLEQLARVPVHSWQYRAEPSGVRHIGPMAQDFHAAFGLGSDDRHVDLIDASGIALAAIQELDRRLRRRDEQVTELERRNSDLSARVAALEHALERAAAR